MAVVLLPPERADLARRALRAVEMAHPQLEGPWCSLAARLAATAGNATRAAGLLLDTGRRDLARGALSSAEATLVRARDLTASDPARSADVDEALAEALVLAGQPDCATDVTAHLVDTLLTLDAELGRLAAAHLRLAKAWTVAGEWSNASTNVSNARPLVRGDTELAARADLLDAVVALGRDDFDTAERLAASVHAAVERTGPADLVCEALKLHGRLARRHDLSGAAAFFERERQTAQAHDLPVWHVRALHELGTVDALDSLRPDRLREAREVALRTGALSVAAHVDLHTTGTHLTRGEFDSALEASRRCDGRRRGRAR